MMFALLVWIATTLLGCVIGCAVFVFGEIAQGGAPIWLLVGGFIAVASTIVGVILARKNFE